MRGKWRQGGRERRQLLEPPTLSVGFAPFSRTRTWDGTRVRHRRKCGWEGEDLQWPQPLLQRRAGPTLKSLSQAEAAITLALTAKTFNTTKVFLIQLFKNAL